MTNDGLALCKWPSAYRTTNFHFRRDIRPLSSTIAHFLLLNGFRSTGFIGNWKSYYRCDLRDARRIHARFVPRDPSFSFFFLLLFLLPFLLPDFRSVNEVIPRRKKRRKTSYPWFDGCINGIPLPGVSNPRTLQLSRLWTVPCFRSKCLFSFWKEVEKSRPSLENIIISNSIPWSLIIRNRHWRYPSKFSNRFD